MQDTLIGFVDAYGYLGIFMLIFVENVFPPIPSEAVLLFGGFLTTNSGMRIIPTIIAATGGSLLGAVALYYVGFIIGKERLTRLLSGRIGKLLRIKRENIDSADKVFDKYGKKAVLICRCIPIVRSLISIPAGMTKMGIVPFLLLTAVGSAVWNSVLVCLGAAAGSAWETCIGYFGVYTSVIAVILILAAAAVFIYAYKSKER